jgi:4-aminobutyrate aminotransferase/(S)-3-amino-2-methylpropionate transaminase
MTLLDIPGPKSKEYLKKGFKLFPGGKKEEAVMAETARAGLSPPPRFVVAKAEDSWLTDVDGNKFIDFSSGWASNNVGNVHPRVLEAVIKAMKQYGFCYNSAITYELAEKLAEISPNKKLTRVSYEISGTDAAEAAVSYAITYKQRPLIICFHSQYHGDSIAARMFGTIGGDRKKGFEAWQGGVLYAPYPYSFRTPLDVTPEEYADYCLWYIESLILGQENIAGIVVPDRVAAILFEPVIAEGGNWVPPDNFIHGLRKLADKYDWLLICDEVLTGWGRTGKMWAIEHWGIDVDLMPIAKGMTGGLMPIAAVMGSEEAMAKTHAYSGSTFAGHPAGCAATLKTIEIMQEQRLPERAAKLGEVALKRMREWVDEYEIVSDARGLGFLLAISIINKETKKLDVDVAKTVFHEAVRNGVQPIWDEEPHIRFYPALTIEKELLDKGLTIVEEAIKKVEREK